MEGLPVPVPTPIAGGGHHDPTRLKLRNYQRRIAAAAVAKNTIVMLPTGSGKTLIAAEVIRLVGAPAVFFVPTCLLVDQQAKALRAWTGLHVAEFMGGARLDSTFDVLVTTPKAFEIAQARGVESLRWAAFRLVAFDEVHHVLKDHPYRKLAAGLRRSGASPRVVGLSASLTYAVGTAKVETAVRDLSAELRAEGIEVADPAEMVADGYIGGVATPAEVVSIDVPCAALATAPGLVPEAERKPHLMLATFLGRVAAGTAAPFTTKLMAAVRAMEAVVAAAGFRSPIDRGTPLREWGEAAARAAASKSSPALKQLEHYYEAVKLLITSWEVEDDAAATYLRMFGTDDADCIAAWPAPASSALGAFWASVPAAFLRFDRLCDVLENKLDSSPDGGFRGIVFVQQRAMTHVLQHIIEGCAALRERLRAACVYAVSSPATPSLRVTPSESAARLKAFAAGAVNLLICTVVAEEGMDVPAANCVIRFDPMLHAVSFVQGRGRARAAGSSYVVLAERADRPVSLLADVERQQLALVGEIARAGCEAGGGTASRLADAARHAQIDRERSAKGLLIGSDSAAALSTLNLFCKKTNVVLAEEASSEAGAHVAVLTYESCLRAATGRGRASTAKAARQNAAAALIVNLL